MPIQFPCPDCETPLATTERVIGQTLACPGCHEPLTVPPESELGEGADDTVRFRRKEEEDEGVDMTPMVDVTFLLLIFFMVTAAYSLQKALEVPPPDQTESAKQTRTLEDIEKDDDYVIVRIGRDNTIWVTISGSECEAPTKQEIMAKLREAKQGTDDSSGLGPTSLLVMADGDAKHESAVMALDAGNAVGMENVRFTMIDEEDL